MTDHLQLTRSRFQSKTCPICAAWVVTVDTRLPPERQSASIKAATQEHLWRFHQRPEQDGA